MIRNYSLLEAEYNQINLSKILFNLDIKNDMYLYQWKRYVEARERRNLLTHRGFKPDKRYYSALQRKSALGQKSAVYLKKNVFTRRLMVKVIDEKRKEGRFKNQNPNSPENLSITRPYFFDIFKSLAFLSVYFFLHTKYIKKRLTVDDGDPLGSLHTLGMLSVKLKLRTILEISDAIFEVYWKKINEDGKKAHPFSIVNHLINDEMLLRSRKYKANKKNLEQIRKALDARKNKYIDFIPDTLGLKKDLIISYLENDLDSFIDITKRMLKKQEISKTALDNWLIFQKYRGKRKFKHELAL